MPTLQRLTEALAELATQAGPWAPLALFFAAFVEHVFPPFPGDLVVVLGAWYAVQGRLPWPLLLAACTAGAAAGAWVDHRLGAALGGKLDRGEWTSRLLTPERLRAFEAAYQRWGPWLIVGNRFLPGIRAFLFVAAGASGLKPGMVVGLGTLSALAWNGLLLGGGALVASNLEELQAFAGHFTRLGAAVVVLGVGGVALRLAWKRRPRG